MIVIIILSICIATCGYVIYNLLTKIEKIEEELDDLSLTVANILTDVENGLEVMDAIDSRGAFEKDDETGSVFNALREIVRVLNNKYITSEKKNG
tara:strand:- start:341 stop:625 length:285 start_codon:yes stop_codon:yes gene_type:complete